MINWFASKIEALLSHVKSRSMQYRCLRYPHISPSARIGTTVEFVGPFESFIIGDHTYINDAILAAGEKSKVVIGAHCAIARRVSIRAISHDAKDPCPDENGHVATIERDIVIGSYCWIGENVFIKEGVTIGNNVIVGANSVVTKSVPDNVVIAGVPAMKIKDR